MNMDQLHMLRPSWLWALVPLVPVFVVLWRASGSSAAWRRVCDPHLLPHLLVKEDGRARRGPLAILALGWIASVVALAGPTWERLPQPSFRVAQPTVVALELAQSMDAADVAPSRLERARFKLIDAFEREPDGQMGLVIFAEEPYVVTPITDDPQVVREMANVLATDLMPGRGCRTERAIEESVALLEQSGGAGGRILLIADGAGDAPELTAAAARSAAQAGHPVSVLAIGPPGHDDEALRAVAEAGNGRFAALTADGGDLAAALPEREPSMSATFEDAGIKTDTWRDMGGFLLLLPLFLAPFAFRRTRLGALVALAALGSGASSQAQGIGDWFSRSDQRAADAFAEERYEEASTEFVDPAWRAASLYRDGRFEEAAQVYGASPSPEHGYNLGNALARSGQLEDALSAYDELLAEEPDHADARHNRDLVQELLDQQEQQQEQQEQDSQNQDGEQGQDDSQSPESQGQDGESEQQDDQDQQGDSPPQEGQEQPSDSQQQEGQEQQDEAQPQDGQEQQGEAQPQDGQEQTSESQQHKGRERQGEAQPPDGLEQQGETEPQEGRDESRPQDGEPPGESRPQNAETRPGDPSGVEDATAGEQADELAERMQPPDPGSFEPAEEEPDDGERYGVDDPSPPREYDEKDQATHQILSRIPDDPGALLREKLRRRYMERRYLQSLRRGW